MNPVRLYCHGACAACSGLARYLGDGGVSVEVHDITTEPDAFDAVVALAYRSLPVLVGPEGSSAQGAEATGFARHLVGAGLPAAGHVHRLSIEEES